MRLLFVVLSPKAGGGRSSFEVMIDSVNKISLIKRFPYVPSLCVVSHDLNGDE